MSEGMLFLYFTLMALFRFISYPLVFLLAYFVPFLRRRIAFERQNKYRVGSRSWIKDGKVADFAFEVSSEGELEQVRPLIDDLLKDLKKIEIIYASPSVEKKIEELRLAFPDQIRVLRLPLVSFFWPLFTGPQVLTWSSAPVLILCRYDFFPEFFLLKFLKKTQLVIVSATFKNREHILARPYSLLWEYWSLLYRQFDFLVAATSQDLESFSKLGILRERLATCDFRYMQIVKRLEKGQKKLEVLGPMRAFIGDFPKSSKLLLAQCWPLEMGLFNGPFLRENIALGRELLVLAPHQLGRLQIDALIRALHENWPQGRAYVFSQGWSEEKILTFIENYKKNPGPIILDSPGLLCELYTLFDHAYIGGGFGRSIHSVLEPLVAQTTVYIGPKVHRSTEYDFFKERAPGHIHIADSLSDVLFLYRRERQKQSGQKRHGWGQGGDVIEKNAGDVMKRVFNVG